MPVSSLLESRLEKLKRLRDLQDELKRQQDVLDGAIKRPWAEIARPEQLPPPGDWMVWLILAGRGWGKTRTGAEWVAMKARRYHGCRIALVGKTFADVRDTLVEGESGLIHCFNRDEFRGHSQDDGYNKSRGALYLDNGSMFQSFTAEKPWRLRGPQFNFALADEACFWKDAGKGLVADTTWSNLVITLRLPKKPDWDEDYRPQIAVATTPRPVALLRNSDPDSSRVGLMQRPTTIITRGRTVDNLENLSKEYQANVIAPLLGTRLGRQELDAELLDDIPGALWKREWIDETRVTDPSLVPDLIRIVVGVDPAVTDNESSAQTGIIVAGAARNGHGYVLGDYTLRATPMEAIKKAIQAYHDFSADRIVAEVNNGGDFIGTLVKTVDPNVPYQSVRATRGKAIRAEPVSSLYEQRRVHHVGSFPYLEDSQCSWTPADPESPDRLDACVWALHALRDLIGGSFLSAYGVIRCESCQHAFTKDDPATKQPRLSCPKCGAAVVLELWMASPGQLLSCHAVDPGQEWLVVSLHSWR
jgi:phage terminase large subunit-like protein